MISQPSCCSSHKWTNWLCYGSWNQRVKVGEI